MNYQYLLNTLVFAIIAIWNNPLSISIHPIYRKASSKFTLLDRERRQSWMSTFCLICCNISRLFWLVKNWSDWKLIIFRTTLWNFPYTIRVNLLWLVLEKKLWISLGKATIFGIDTTIKQLLINNKKKNIKLFSPT